MACRLPSFPSSLILISVMSATFSLFPHPATAMEEMGGGILDYYVLQWNTEPDPREIERAKAPVAIVGHNGDAIEDGSPHLFRLLFLHSMAINVDSVFEWGIIRLPLHQPSFTFK